MHAHCSNCHADYPKLVDLPLQCPTCGSVKMLEVPSDLLKHPYLVTHNDEKFLKDRGIKND